MALIPKQTLQRIARMPAPAILALAYALLILAGAALFMLPFARTIPISWGDALFTATSAVTVTGLAVFDIGTGLTLFGQVVLALLIQLGGLGLMTFAVLVLAALGLPVGITGHVYLREDLNQSSMTQVRLLMKTIAKVVLFCEMTGTLLLALVFVPQEGVWQGLWTALFHAISAFNNAGFSTFPNGLVPYATDPIVNIVIPALFIVGGIGYVVLQDVFNQRDWRRWTLHTKIMLLGTAVLIPWSVGLFAFLEWHNTGTLGHLHGAVAKLTVSWFQGVTTRTAGFNTTDISAMHDSTTMMFISMMLIGGGPTSTAGGIKVTTFVVMLIATMAFFRRQSQLHAFGRSISLDEVLKVMALTAISVLVVFIGVFLLAASHEGHFLDISFEVASAFGTVGLSRGFTGDLSGFGRAVIMAIMFLGRVGPLTLGFFLATRSTPRVRYPAGQIHLG
ncbi:TrkH family potassium uptake protein [Pseudooceanicola nanhaiensis]|uniref:TrkH family potassium uptake protein n=1 Tax=Pseudooceanicola nanhaiensis TaxID=375761 RepID=UPI001CD1B11C|nr:potassium transporter TrkG [Pseudooceanicola nanhaiensis]MCA0920504.1 Ktr system potassium transporter B [Pseudooceanicola nanhaiensis]